MENAIVDRRILLSGMALTGAEVPRQSPEYALMLPGGSRTCSRSTRAKLW